MDPSPAPNQSRCPSSLNAHTSIAARFQAPKP